MTIFAKPILASPKRLQRMRLRLQKYSLKVEYKQGPRTYISDTLSRATVPQQDIVTDTPAYVIFQLAEEHQFQEELASVIFEDCVFVTDERLQTIRAQPQRHDTTNIDEHATHRLATGQSSSSIVHSGLLALRR